jgi:hypothetical protein
VALADGAVIIGSSLGTGDVELMPVVGKVELKSGNGSVELFPGRVTLYPPQVGKVVLPPIVPLTGQFSPDPTGTVELSPAQAGIVAFPLIVSFPDTGVFAHGG